MRIIRSDGTMTYPAFPMPTGNIIASYTLSLTVNAIINPSVIVTVTDITDTGLYLISCWLESYNFVGTNGGTFNVTHWFASAGGATIVSRLLFAGPIDVAFNQLDAEQFSLPAWCVAGTPITIEYDAPGFSALNPGDSCDIFLRTTVSRLI